MRRRDFLALVGGATATSALWDVARAQDGERVRHLGVLMPFVEGDAEGQSRLAAFREALQKLGWTEGKNLRVDYRWSPPGAKELQDSARQLLALKPEILFSPATPTTTALRQLPHQIPIVFTNIADPIGSGFVEPGAARRSCHRLHEP
jgi:putative ABC transport system substrate-binding protein